MERDYNDAEVKQVKEILKGLEEISSSPRAKKIFISYLAVDHRTYQQSITGMMLMWFEHLACLSDGQYDLRNAASVGIAKVLMEAIQEVGMSSHLPYI